jgi:phosphate transport system permease protein
MAAGIATIGISDGVQDVSAPTAPLRDVEGLAGAAFPGEATRLRRRRWRAVKDGVSRYTVGTGGISVIVALALIFVYLFSEVGPLLSGASIERRASFDPPGSAAPTLVASTERFREVGFRLAADGSAAFFRVADGRLLSERALPIPEGAAITAFAAAEPRRRLSALGLSDGRVILARDAYDLVFSGGVRSITHELQFPYGAEPAVVDEEGRALTHLGIQEGQRGLVVVARTEDGRLLLVSYAAQRNLITGQTTLRRQAVELPRPGYTPTEILLSIDLRDLLIGDDQGRIHYYDIGNLGAPRLVQSRRVIDGDGASVGAMAYLLGTVSVIVGGSDGSLAQWFLVRDEANVRHLTRIRVFQPHAAAVTSIVPEHARKGFVTADAAGEVAVHFSTSHRTLVRERVGDRPIAFASASPRNDALIAIDDSGRFHLFEMHNEHPQVSIQALWGRVWYEGRSGPDYVWQSSSATDEFESKFSLMPLTLGTIKAAFYAMLFAMPLAIMGAIYSAYFMSPRLRGMTKPTIEIMEALPTVILGFLAGLWFAPFVERHLPAVFGILLLMPPGILLAAWLWSLLPRDLRLAVPPGMEAVLIMPAIILIAWGCVAMSPVVELWFFAGDMRQWLTDVGITYDQRNALVVGVAMGFAVIPTIYSIAEDAIFNVPKHLTQGSLALGATTWQTVTRVVLLTASPGIFSAVMIGLGRAVGETMIVLMATGNSPIMNFNIFEGMRTLSANIAVEMPEAEFGGTHYRILFLAALVLFVMTFVLNTAAEIVRQRLRRKYASI